MVAGRDKGHLGHNSFLLATTDLDLELSARLVDTVLDVSHGNVLLDRWGGTSRGDLADQLTVGVDEGTLTGRGSLDKETNAAARNTVLELVLNLGSAQEASLGTATLANSPGQTGLNRGDSVIQIVAVQAQTGLESQAVTGTQASQLHARIGNQQLGELDGVTVRDGDLETILASVSGAGNVAVDTLDVHEAAIHEGEILEALANETLKDLSGLGALKSNQLVVVNDLEVDIATLVLEVLEVGTDVSQILVGASGIRDNVERILVLADDGVINDATILVGEDRQGRGTDGQVLNVSDGDRLVELDTVLASDSGGQHVADVKDGSVLAGPDVGSTDSEVGVLDGHGPASKGDHLTTVLDVVVVEDGLLQDLYVVRLVMLRKGVSMVSCLVLSHLLDFDPPSCS